MNPQQELNLVHFDDAMRQMGHQVIAGVDEAGRGPLAGPVVAAACILPEGRYVAGVNDSKQLTPQQRRELYARLTEDSEIVFGVGVVEAVIIDQINILQATLRAMIAAVALLRVKPDVLLIDGNHVPKTDIPMKAIVEGDSKSQSIAAASIIAKETRDKMMCDFDKMWPEYGFAQHKGYGTKMHLEALQKYGPCPIHRRSFDPVRRASAT